MIDGFRVSNKADRVVISHLQFADDHYVFLGSNKGNTEALKNLLIWFELVSRLRINLHKYELYKVGEVAGYEELASILGCEIDTFSTMYLGLL